MIETSNVHMQHKRGTISAKLQINITASQAEVALYVSEDDYATVKKLSLGTLAP